MSQTVLTHSRPAHAIRAALIAALVALAVAASAGPARADNGAWYSSSFYDGLCANAGGYYGHGYAEGTASMSEGVTGSTYMTMRWQKEKWKLRADGTWGWVVVYTQPPDNVTSASTLGAIRRRISFSSADAGDWMRVRVVKSWYRGTYGDAYADTLLHRHIAHTPHCAAR